MNVKVTITMELEVDDDDMPHAKITTRVKKEASQFRKDFPELLCDNQDIFVLKRKGAVIVE